METIFSAAMTALWLGIMTSISPCPLATNIAAVSFVAKRLESTGGALWAGAAYVIGRLVAYVLLAVIVTAGLLTIPGVSNFLQKYMNYLLGPVLILVGVVLLDILPFSIPGISPSQKMQARASRGGTWSASLLGALFALSFCPVSAALFFGSLIPLAVTHHSYILLPSLYGIGTGLPVMAFGLVIAFSTQSVAKLFKQVTKFELWFRRITGVVFILVGIYYCLIYFAGIEI